MAPRSAVGARIGEQIRRLRSQRGIPQQVLAELAGFSFSTFKRIEAGRTPTVDELDAIAAVLRVTREDLLPESEATATRPLTLLEVPPVKRREFLEALGMSATALGSAALVAGLHQILLDTGEPAGDPVRYFEQVWRVLRDEDNVFGPAEVIPKVERQIRTLHGLRDRYRGPRGRELLHLEAEFAESCGWLYQDLGEYESAQYWMDRALQWSHAAQDREFTVFILARKSQLAGDMADPQEAVDMAEAAMAAAAPFSRLTAVAATYAAHGYALTGDRGRCERAYEHAREVLEHVNGVGPQSRFGVWLDAAYIDAQRAQSLAVLEDYHVAAERFRSALLALPDGYPRDRGVYQARAALATLGDGDPEGAATLGLRALGTGVETGSGRIVIDLVRLDHALTQTDAAAPVVKDFRDAMKETFPRHT